MDGDSADYQERSVYYNNRQSKTGRELTFPNNPSSDRLHVRQMASDDTLNKNTGNTRRNEGMMQQTEVRTRLESSITAQTQGSTQHSDID